MTFSMFFFFSLLLLKGPFPSFSASPEFYLKLWIKPVHACMLSHFSFVQIFVTVWAVACQACLSMRFSRQEYWSGLPCSPPEYLPNPGMEPGSFALQVDSLPLSPWESPRLTQ